MDAKASGGNKKPVVYMGIGIALLSACVGLAIGVSKIPLSKASTPSESVSSSSGQSSIEKQSKLRISSDYFAIDKTNQQLTVTTALASGGTDSVVFKSADSSKVGISKTTSGTPSSYVMTNVGSPIYLTALSDFSEPVKVSVYTIGNEVQTGEIECYWNKYISGVSVETPHIVF